MSKWIIKVVINALSGVREVHPPYNIDINTPVRNYGSNNDLIQLKFLVFETKLDAEYYFDQYENFEEVKLIKENHYGNKLTTINQIEVNYIN